MKKLTLLLMIISFCFVISACGKAKYQKIELMDSTKLEEFEYEESQDVKDAFDIYSVEHQLPEDTPKSAYCIYNDVLYYVVDYTEFLLDQTGEKGNIPFEEKYNTQIRAFDLESKEDRLIYQYDETRCTKVTDIVCNGIQIVWEDYSDNKWIIKCMLLDGAEEKPKTITSQEQSGEGLWSITLTIKQDGLYWYNIINENEENFMALYKYDFKTETIETLQEELILTSPYEHYVEVDGCYATYETYKTEKEERAYIINIYNKEKGTQTDLYTDNMVCTPVTNGKFCVWMKSFEASDRQEMYIYNLIKDTYEVISAEHFSSYVLIEDYLITNQRLNNKIVCYDIANKKYAELFSEENTSISYLNPGENNNAYFRKNGTDYINIIKKR